MQALVLAGGEGTRLRPLTLTTPKPVIPLAGRPFLTFMLDWVASHGVDEVILSCGFMSDGVREVLGDIHAGMRLRYVIEEEPLGTAGPVRLALDEGLLQERLFVLNGDVLNDMDITAQLARHEETGRTRHAGADRGGGHIQLRRGAHGRGRQGGGVPREVRRPGAHEPHQRGRLRAGALRGRGDRARPRRVVRARGVSPAGGGRRPLRLRRRPGTGSTSALPSATSRRPTTCSPAGSDPRCRHAT